MEGKDMTKPVTEMMEKGLTIMRMENETQQAMAVQRPRDIEDLTERAIAELRAFPEYAQKAYYVIPHKDGDKTVNVEGPSIKAANALTRYWGNNSSGFRVVGTDDERILLQGVFLDYETNVRRTAEISVPRMVWSKQRKQMEEMRGDWLNKAIQAGGSKAVRNAILNSLPIGLVERYKAEAKSIAARGGKKSEGSTAAADISANMERMVKAFEVLGLERKEVSDYVNRHPELEDEEQVVAHLVGIHNAIEDGQTTVEEVFTVPAGAPISEPQPTSAPASKTAPKAERTIDPKWRRMQSKISGGSCADCHKEITKGAWMYWDNDSRRARHEVCPA